MDFAVAFKGSDPDPAHTGDIKSWFFYYKWRLDEDDEVFVPVDNEVCETAVAGDTVWFLMDGLLIGKTTLLRIQYDPFNGRKELWFKTKSCVAAREGSTVYLPAVETGVVGPAHLSVMQDYC